MNPIRQGPHFLTSDRIPNAIACTSSSAPFSTPVSMLDHTNTFHVPAVNCS